MSSIPLSIGTLTKEIDLLFGSPLVLKHEPLRQVLWYYRTDIRNLIGEKYDPQDLETLLTDEVLLREINKCTSRFHARLYQILSGNEDQELADIKAA